MITESCKEEELREKLAALNTTLKNAFTQYERDKELVGNPVRWVTRVIDAIREAHQLLRERKEHPELKYLFEQLEESLHRAHNRLPDYAKRHIITLPDDL